MGTLSDRGAAALLAGQPLTHLRALNVGHHYMSEGMVARLVAELPDVVTGVDDWQDPEGGRYPMITE
jgi:hypothetical protein